MYTFLLYIIKVSLTLAAFYLFYKLLCSRDTWHRANRILLLTILALSAAVPFMYIDLGMVTTEATVAIEELSPMTTTKPIAETAEAVSTHSSRTDNIEMVTASKPNPWEHIPWHSLLVSIYLIGLAVYIIKFISGLVSIVQLIRNSKRYEITDGTLLVTHTKDYSPFSWMRYIIVSEHDLQENRDMILAHEQAHIRLGHSWDLLFVQLYAIMQWFNPFVWFVKRELEAIHEYEADSATLCEGIDTHQYQLCLFESAVGAKFCTMTNNFTNCSTKQRIIMMTKKHTSRWALLKALYMLPVALATVAIISCASPRENKATYPIRIGLNDVEQYSINDFGEEPTITIDYQRGSTGYKAHLFQKDEYPNPIELFLKGGAEREKLLERFCLTEADVDSVVILFPGEKHFYHKDMENGHIIIFTQKRDIVDKHECPTDPLTSLIFEDGSVLCHKMSGGYWKLWNYYHFLAFYGLNEDNIAVETRFPNKEGERLYGKKGAEGVIRLTVIDKTKQEVMQAIEENSKAFKRFNRLSLSRKDSSDSPREGDVYYLTDIDEMPYGDDWIPFWHMNLQYPKIAREIGIEGHVGVQFTVNKDGSIDDATVIRSVDPLLDTEALRLVRNMPNWTPGKYKGKTVRSRYTLWVIFDLDREYGVLPQKKRAQTN